MSDYVIHLAENTDVAAGRNNLAKTILISVCLTIWALSLIVFWFFTDGSDAMGYSIMFLWVLLPVTAFVVSLLIGRNDYWGKWKWLSAPIFGIMYMLAEYATFECANMAAHAAAFRQVNMPQLEMIPYAAAISLLGIAVGNGIRRIKARRLK